MIFSTKFSVRFSNLLEIICAKFYSDLLRFDISTVRYIGGYFIRTQCRISFDLLWAFVQQTVRPANVRVADCCTICCALLL